MSASQFRETQTFNEIFGESVDGEMTVIAGPGNLDLDGEIDGTISLGVSIGLSQLGGLFTGGAVDDTVNVSYSVDVANIRSRLNNVFNQVQGQINQIENIASLAGVGDGPVATSPTDVINQIRDNIGGIPDERLSLRAIGPSVGEIGDTPVIFGFEQVFPTITIPTVGGRVLDQLPPVEFTVTISAVDLLQRAVEGADSFTFEIPAATFINTVDISDIGCDEVRGRIMELESFGEDALDRAQQNLNQLENIRDSMGNVIGQRSPGVSQLVNRVQDIRQNASSSQLNRWESDIRDISIDPTPGNRTLGGLLTQAQEVNIPSPCDSNLRDRLNNLQDQLQQTRNITDRVRNLRSSLIEVFGDGIPCTDRFSDIDNDIRALSQDISRASSPSPSTIRDFRNRADDISNRINNINDNQCIDQFTNNLQSVRNNISSFAQRVQPAVNCTDPSVTPRSLQNSVDTYVSDAREFSRLREIERQEERFNTLINRGDNLIDRINNEVTESECVQQLRDRVQSARSRAEAAGPRRAEIVPCGQQHTSIDNAVEEFEDTVSQLSVPVEPQTQQQIANQGLELINQIEDNVEPGRCREDFVSRIRGASSRVRGLTERVRVTRVEEAQDQAEETLQQLLQQIQQIQVRRGSGVDRDELL